MMPQLLIPIRRWKVDAEPANEQSTIRLSGRALSGTSQIGKHFQTILPTANQAHELVSALNLALLELELQRTADVDRAAWSGG